MVWVAAAAEENLLTGLRAIEGCGELELIFQRRTTFQLRVLVKILPALANECSEVQRCSPLRFKLWKSKQL